MVATGFEDNPDLRIILENGVCFGEAAIIRAEKRNATVMTESAATVLKIPVKKFEELTSRPQYFPLLAHWTVIQASRVAEAAGVKEFEGEAEPVSTKI